MRIAGRIAGVRSREQSESIMEMANGKEDPSRNEHKSGMKRMEDCVCYGRMCLIISTFWTRRQMPAGEEKLQEQEAVLKKFYGSVIESFGTDKLIQLLQLMQELETTMSLAFEKMEDKDAEDIS